MIRRTSFIAYVVFLTRSLLSLPQTCTCRELTNKMSFLYSDNVNVPCQRVLIERNVTVSVFIKNANQVRQKIQLPSKVQNSLHFYISHV